MPKSNVREIYAKAKQRVTGFTAEDSSEDEDDSWDEGGHRGPTDNDKGFN